MGYASFSIFDIDYTGSILQRVFLFAKQTYRRRCPQPHRKYIYYSPLIALRSVSVLVGLLIIEHISELLYCSDVWLCVYWGSSADFVSTIGVVNGHHDHVLTTTSI